MPVTATIIGKLLLITPYVIVPVAIPRGVGLLITANLIQLIILLATGMLLLIPAYITVTPTIRKLLMIIAYVVEPVTVGFGTAVNFIAHFTPNLAQSCIWSCSLSNNAFRIDYECTINITCYRWC